MIKVYLSNLVKINNSQRTKYRKKWSIHSLDENDAAKFAIYQMDLYTIYNIVDIVFVVVNDLSNVLSSPALPA